jgi:multiple sugar transport system permease protein
VPSGHQCGPWRQEAALLAFIYVWTSLIVVLILGGGNTSTITPSALCFPSLEQAVYGQMAAAIMGIVPILILALFAQRYLVRGLILGAVKG